MGIYVRDGIKFSHLPECSIFVERIFESIYIEVSTEDNKKIIIGSVYRPGILAVRELLSRNSFLVFRTLSLIPCQSYLLARTRSLFMVILTSMFLSLAKTNLSMITSIPCFLLVFYKLSPNPQGWPKNQQH